MSRWEPNAKGRLERAALDLYQERGYDQTTVTEIAERAGLTERTFFRHFTDKREVLFGEQENLLEMCISAIEAAPDTSTPIETIIAALKATVPMFRERREIVRQRQSVIAANPALQERELLKVATFTFAMADALSRRGVKDPEASLAANTGVLVFKAAYARWAAEPGAPDLSRLIQAVFDQLKSILSG
jgi:AcrR family transcriptional regulator